MLKCKTHFPNCEIIRFTIYILKIKIQQSLVMEKVGFTSEGRKMRSSFKTRAEMDDLRIARQLSQSRKTK